MKTLSYRVFYIMFEITFLLYMLVAIAFLGIEVKNLIDDEYAGNYTLRSFDSEIVLACKEEIKVNQTHTKLAGAHVETGDWRLKFRSHDFYVKAFMLLLSFIQIIYVFSILSVLRKFVLSLKLNSFFTKENVNRLRIVGILILLIGPLHLVLRNIVRLWVTEYLSVEFPSTAIHKISLGISFEVGFWTWVLFGLLILVITEVFRQGLRLKEEQDLTI